MQQKIYLLFFLLLIFYSKAQILEKDTLRGGVEKQIQVVELLAKKKLIEREVDRLVFNVEQAVAIQGGNALDALKNTPRVKVENGAVSIIGKGNLMIMVNDKILRLSGADLSEYLKTINIEEIKKIEVITNPPSKYNAEGNSGIINVVTKKSKNNSWNASLRSTFTQATHTAENIGEGYNMKKGKLELSSFLRYNNGSNAPVMNGHRLRDFLKPFISLIKIDTISYFLLSIYLMKPRFNL